MCGRFAGYRDLEALRGHFPIDRVEADPSPNHNVAPSQTIPAIVRLEGGNILRAFRWGLVPFWAKNPATGSRLIPADGFYGLILLKADRCLALKTRRFRALPPWRPSSTRRTVSASSA